MPRSNMSKISMAPSGVNIHNSHISAEAARLAKESANQELAKRIQNGQLRQPLGMHDHEGVEAWKREYLPIYKLEYYKFYAQLLQQNQLESSPRVIYVENPAATRYLLPHTIINFSKANHFIYKQGNRIRIGRINCLLDSDTHTETKEAFLTTWPGPLDRADDSQLKQRVTGYIDTLCQSDVERRIRYCNTTNDDHRKLIIILLTKLLHMNGSIDAPGTTDLLLDSQSTEIQRDESNKNPLRALQKLLLRGKRAEAVNLAKDRRLWEHAQCLAFLHKYQPGPNAPVFQRDNQGYSRLRDDSLIKLNIDYIESMDESQKLLNIVYRSLLNRILASDPESTNMVKNHNVGNNFYEFALLSANDCDLEYDLTNELFKLILAVKRAKTLPDSAYSHLISLGYSSLDSYDPGEDLFAANRSYTSFNQADTPTSKTLIISNMDLLILNEIWEYCLNLAEGTCNNPAGYKYIVNLIPYKLVFASKLLDYGLYEKFQYYLSSLEHALYKGRAYQAHNLDMDYDWDSIQQSVYYLRGIWSETFSKCPELANRLINNSESFTHMYQTNEFTAIPPLAGYDQPLPNAELNHQESVEDYSQGDHVDHPNNQQDYSIPYQPPAPPQPAQVQNVYHNYSNQYKNPPPVFNNNNGSLPPYSGNSLQWQTQEEITDFNPDPDPQSEPAFSPQSHEGNPYEPVMTSSSPVGSRRESTQSHNMMGQSFANAFSPIEQPIVDDPYDDVPRPRNQDQHHQQHQQQHQQQVPPPFLPQPMRAPQFNNTIPSNHQLPSASHDSGMNSRPTNRSEGESSGGHSMGNNNNNKPNDNKTTEDKSQPSGDQQGGILSNFIGTAKSLIPRTNSKLFMAKTNEVHLPDDKKKTIIFDEKLGKWVDTDPQAKDSDDTVDEPPPPMMMTQTRQQNEPPMYATNLKSTKNRYPKPNIA